MSRPTPARPPQGGGHPAASFAFPLLLIWLAALLRIGWPTLTEFKYDEARLSALALDWVQGGPLPLAGMPSSVGLSNPPVSVYLLALPYALSPDPLVATVCVGLVNVLGVALCYALARRWFGPTGAWVSALWFAVGPWAVLYARKLWAQDLLPPFVLLCLAAAYFGLVEGRARWQALFPFALAITLQIHFSTLALIPWALLALILYRHRVTRALWLGVALGALTWVPYLLFQREHWLTEAGHLLTRATGTAHSDATALRYLWLLASGSEIHSLAGPEQFRTFLASLPPYEWLFALGGTAVLAGLALLAARALHPQTPVPTRGAALLVVTLAATPVLWHTRHSLPVYPHYFIVLLPALYLAAGALAAWVSARAPQMARGVAVGALAVALGQASVLGALGAFVATHATPGGFGGPLGAWRAVAAEIRATPACAVIVPSTGTDPRYDELPALFSVLLRDDARIQFTPAAAPAWPPYSALIVVAPGNAPPADAVLRTTLPFRPGEPPVTLYAHLPVTATTDSPPRATFANGARLLTAYSEPRAQASGTVRLHELWELPAAPPDTDIHVFNHVLASDGLTLIGQADGEACPSAHWQAGLRVWATFDVTLTPDTPPGPYTVQTGLYTYPAITPIPLADGAPAAVWTVP